MLDEGVSKRARSARWRMLREAFVSAVAVSKGRDVDVAADDDSDVDAPDGKYQVNNNRSNNGEFQGFVLFPRCGNER